MRVRLALIPFAVGAALIAGCTTTATTDAQSTPTATPTSTVPDNGVSALSGKEIYDKALAAFTAAKSVHLAGAQDDKDKVDIIVSAGKSGGSLTIDGSTVEARIIGTDAYIKADKSFYVAIFGETLGALMGAANANKWQHGKTTDPQVALLVALFNPKVLLDSTGGFTKGATKVVDGTPTIAIADSAADGYTLYVATTGEPRPLLLEPKAGGAIKITYDEPVNVEAPPAADVVELTPAS